MTPCLHNQFWCFGVFSVRSPRSYSVVVGGCRCSPPCRREKGRVTTILFGGVGNLYIMKPLSAGLSLLVSELIWNLCLVSPVLGEEHRGRVLNLL